MNVVALARKDIRDATRSRMTWGLTGAFTLLSVLGVSLFALLDVADATTIDALGLLVLPSILLVPLAAIVVGYMSVVGERRSGSLKLLLGFPIARRTVISGKLIGRTAVVALAVTVAFTVAGVVAAMLYGSVPVVHVGAVALATVGLGSAFVGLAVGISAAVRTRGRALAGAIGSYFLLVMFWQPVVGGIHYVVTGTLPGIEVPAWYLFVERLSPVAAYQVLVQAALNRSAAGSLFAVRPPAAASAPIVEQLGGGPVPFYLSAPAGAVVLLLWIAIPVGLGYWRFRHTDL